MDNLDTYCLYLIPNVGQSCGMNTNLACCQHRVELEATQGWRIHGHKRNVCVFGDCSKFLSVVPETSKRRKNHVDFLYPLFIRENSPLRITNRIIWGFFFDKTYFSLIRILSFYFCKDSI